jgi:bifunctional non-homologous end joining protein LigD
VWHSNRAASDQPEVKAVRAGAKPAKKSRAKSKKKRPAAKRKAAKKTKKRKRAVDLSGLPGIRKCAIPDFVEPSLATLSANAPDSADWLHEIKFDGYRMQARIADGRISLKTRTGLDWTGRFEGIAEALKEIPVGRAIIDGEIVSQERDGVSSFSALQEDLKSGREDRMAFYAFDLLYRDGFDLTGVAFSNRKKALTALMHDVPEGLPVHLSESFETSGSKLLKAACQMNLEGIISKRASAPYRGGRVGDWIKTKCTANQEFVITGYEPSTTMTRSIRALILGYFEEGQLRYAGRVGTGFTVAVERDLLKNLNTLKTGKMPFAELPEEERRRKVQWLAPKLVAEIDFRGWTHGEVLRQASFKGLREDKAAKDVVREMPRLAAAAQTVASKKSKPARKLSTQKTKHVEVAGVTLTHPDRIYWKDGDVTKAMLADYYRQIWKWVAPHLVDRPIALVRCPDGAESKCFFQKHVSAGLEEDELVSVPLKGEEPAIAVDDLSGLIALAQAGVLELHAWGTHRQHVESCDFLVFDLDPGPGITMQQLVEGAREVRSRLAKMKLKTFVKTTGGKGLHVVLPIAPTDWDKAKDFAHALADAMEADNPQRYVANMAKSKRNNRIFVDYLRNGRGATAIAPYSTRARPGAPVAAPVTWEELGSLKSPNQFTLLNMPKRLARLKRDPWAGMSRIKQKLPR